MKTFLVVIAMAFFAATAFAETYVWEDDHGTVNFADDLGKVPKKYRKKARIVGEEQPAAAEVPEEGKEQPAVQKQTEGGRGEAPRGNKEVAPAAKVNKNAVYGGKDASAWKSEFAGVKTELKANENQLVENRNRLKDTSGMSRSEYLSIQYTVKSLENAVLGLRKKLEDLKQEADKAGVPAELME
ncbi:MAG TPA: DUF4124 domain-containing protein [Geobacteraceae bacterium]|nr:DUF4124 domain-containing protein [Geobacteraceae bacterium]